MPTIRLYDETAQAIDTIRSLRHQRGERMPGKINVIDEAVKLLLSKERKAK